ncbi:uncharacterized protein BT62DRAFT_1013389 [Guyanagaster necrorhizus]|uniref:Uncharacterized protein n=1 Tax=Guyanagaster necrorhizus TaxID=856835 RepID=A0A9P7VF78_9AGAR|nr:uncharacterized protein BT62DRAFT_1013389 [Guyanagaster necrorhizus MCA 3950]KAG7439846.1 hypothetical protein BT62DRAFT_1013389 [Guyanagaster necrorhizus MCA 3950]
MSILDTKQSTTTHLDDPALKPPFCTSTLRTLSFIPYRLYHQTTAYQEVMSFRFLCHGCEKMDIALEPIVVCQCGEFWCSSLCLEVFFGSHFTDAPHLKHGFFDYFPRPDQEIISQDLRRTNIRGLIFNQNRSAPIEISLTFLYRHGEIPDHIPILWAYFRPDELACRRVGERGSDPPFELWYHKNQMQLFVQDPNSVNNTIVSLTDSLEVQKLWYGPVIAVILQRDEDQLTYTNVESYHMDVVRRFFTSYTCPCVVY